MLTHTIPVGQKSTDRGEHVSHRASKRAVFVFCFLELAGNFQLSDINIDAINLPTYNRIN